MYGVLPSRQPVPIRTPITERFNREFWPQITKLKVTNSPPSENVLIRRYGNLTHEYGSGGAEGFGDVTGKMEKRLSEVTEEGSRVMGGSGLDAVLS